MNVWIGNDPEEFAARARPYLVAERLTTNVIGVQLAGVRAGARPIGSDDLWAAVCDATGIVGAAMHTPPHHLFVGRMPAGAADALAEALAARDRRVPGVSGELGAAGAFAAAWQELTGHSSERLTAMRMYRLGALTPPPDVPGRVRVAATDDTELVQDWFGAFYDEAMPDRPDPGPGAATAEMVARRVAAGLLLVWEDDEEPVALAGFSRPAAGVSRIGPVYTPPGARRRGYGSAATSAATRAALDLGAADVVLYTDLANPTSNSMYQRIGYRPDHDAEERRFEP